MAEIAVTMPNSMIQVADLTQWEGKNISKICDAGYTDDKKNHCAHFVGHAMNYSFGYTCKKQTGKGAKGACLRVNEIFARCVSVGKWDDKPKELNGCLAFVTSHKNVDLAKGTMTDHPKKHIGIFVDGTIWHYSNTQDKVVTTTPEKFAKHYSGEGITLYYGKFPI